MSPASPRTDRSIGRTLFTIGHSTHPIERFLELLSEHRIAMLADIRSFPSSRKWTQFNQADLARSVAGAGIEYRWLKRLGGRRHGVRPDSPHISWTHPAFRSYADYMDGEEFARGIQELSAIASEAATAIMCSEGLWWRCHRRLVSDQMLTLGWNVMHILPTGKLAQHSLTEFARIADGRLIYDRMLTPDLK
jgi:uncharacterized protein (DUF488 family)